jgi:hypothetical protein
MPCASIGLPPSILPFSCPFIFSQTLAGFTESSDGTGHRKINYESRHISAIVPTYAPGVDDSDSSTWKPRTRFLEVAPSLSHTAHSQVEGEKLLAMKVAAAFTNCPSSKAAGISMSWQDWFRKELAQMSDHANDQKAKKDEKDDVKHQILIEDLGSQEAEALSVEELLNAVLAISQDEIEEKSGKSFDELYVFSHSSVYC